MIDTKALQELRKVLWNSRGNRPHEDGIFLVWKTRYTETANHVVKVLRSLGGDVGIRRSTKMIGDGCKYRPWVLTFTVSCPVDAYLGKRMNLRQMRLWLADGKVK